VEVIGEDQVNTEETMETHQAIMVVIQTDGLTKIMAEDTAVEEITETQDMALTVAIGAEAMTGAETMNGTEEIIGTGKMTGTGIVKETEETKTAIGGIKQKMKFLHGLEMKMQKEEETWMI
jgi:hypothetical protein